jgi:hypothetical protein
MYSIAAEVGVNIFSNKWEDFAIPQINGASHGF